MNQTTNETQPSGAITLADLEKCMDEAKANAVQPYPELPLWIDFTSLFDKPQTRCIGTGIDQHGVEHEIWQHVYTPQEMSYDGLGLFFNTSLGDGRFAIWNEVPMSRQRRNQLQRLYSQAKRAERWQKIRRRQRRAAQRRHNRGGV